MKTLTFDQMEQVNGVGWGKCLWGIGLTAGLFAATIATGGLGTPFLIGGIASMVAAAGAGESCAGL